MSKLLGSPGDRLPLAGAVDLIAASARQGGRPSSIWLAGLFYPGLQVSLAVVFGIVESVELATGLATGVSERLFRLENVLPLPSLLTPNADQGTLWRILLLSLLPFLVFLSFRLMAGLAWLAAPETWERERRGAAAPGLLETWNAGKGLTLSALGLWVAMRILNLGAYAFFLGPPIAMLHVLEIEESGFLLTLGLLPFGLLAAAYAVMLEVLTQFALHSLVQNRRGVGSAVLHGWRLMRREPLSVMRATLVDMALQMVVFLGLLAVSPLEEFGCCFLGLGALIALLLRGCLGALRAGYWARIYRLLGGMSRDDGVPGLSA